MPTVQVGDQQLYYEDTGGNGLVVVFSHGLLMDRTMFAPQIAALSAKYRVISWDERGHGNTGDAAAPFSYYDSAADVVGLLKQLSIPRAIFAGMSQGGYLSLRAAIRYPEVVAGLVLIDTQALPEDPATLPHHTALINGWVANGLDDQTAAVLEHIILGTGYANAPAWKAKWKLVRPANLMQIFNTLVTRDDISELVSQIKVPTLVIHGDADNAIPLANAEELARRIPLAKLEVIPGAGHAANLTHAELVTPLIESFLERF
jgi:pimeloyl-ACP methyl ester carboxylesterase